MSFTQNSNRMKTLNQIIRYTSQCSFQDDDWQMVLAYCRERYGGGKIHKSLSPISESTYDEFIEWIDSGFGAGDFVSYGNTMGVIGDCTPKITKLIAYCDYDGNLMLKKTMEVETVSRLQRLDKERMQVLKKKIYDKGLDINQRTASMVELYMPKENFYVTLGDEEYGDFRIGMYLESNGHSHHFSAFLDEKGKLKMDCWIDIECTPFRPASEKDIQRLHQATSDAGWSFNGRTNSFIKAVRRGHNNVYWYLNDRFEIVMDKDNSSKKHTERYGVGNYFIDYTEALLFMKEVINIRKGGK